jgi:hypothetical protein
MYGNLIVFNVVFGPGLTSPKLQIPYDFKLFKFSYAQVLKKLCLRKRHSIISYKFTGISGKKSNVSIFRVEEYSWRMFFLPKLSYISTRYLEPVSRTHMATTGGCKVTQARFWLRLGPCGHSDQPCTYMDIKYWDNISINTFIHIYLLMEWLYRLDSLIHLLFFSVSLIHLPRFYWHPVAAQLKIMNEEAF